MRSGRLGRWAKDAQLIVVGSFLASVLFIGVMAVGYVVGGGGAGGGVSLSVVLLVVLAATAINVAPATLALCVAMAAVQRHRANPRFMLALCGVGGGLWALGVWQHFWGEAGWVVFLGGFVGGIACAASLLRALRERGA